MAGARLLGLCCALVVSAGYAGQPAVRALEVGDTARAPIPDGEAAGVSRSVTLAAPSARVEAIAVRVEVRHVRRGDLSLTLTAPSGRQAQLFQGALRDERRNVVGVLGRLALGPLRGEPVEGTWTLTVVDQRAGGRGSLVHWALLVDASEAAPAEPIDDPASRLQTPASWVREALERDWAEGSPG